MATERQVVLETAQLTKIFRDFWMRPKVKAVDRVDLQVYSGEVFGLLGPNGSGKSTLIKILLGLLFPTQGRAAIFGRDPRNLAIKDRIGYMPEESYLYRYLNAEETLDFYGRLFNLPPHERRHRVELLLEMVGLTHQRKRPVVEYSKGMARRIGLAQALINDPDLIFLDEPTTGLDPIGTREIKDLIFELKRRGKTVILCSHLLADVEDVCDRVAIMYGGKIRRLGTLDELLSLRAKTQITVDALKKETLRRMLDLVREMEGEGKEVEVGSPKDRLESFFLRVVEEARAANVQTSGVTAGAGAASYFGAIEREAKADDLLKDLMADAPVAKPEVPTDAPVVLPASVEKEKTDEKMISELVVLPAGQPAPAQKKEEEKKDEPVVLPASKERPEQEVRREVLDGLLNPGQAEEKKDEGKPGQSRSEK